MKICEGGDTVYAARFSGDRWQTVAQHCKNVSALCGEFGKNAGVSELARLCGLLHDMGKYTDAFQTYIKSAKEHEDDGDLNWAKTVKKEDHGVYGAEYIFGLYGKSLDPYERMTADIASIVICYHHGGLCDCINDGDEIPMILRFVKNVNAEEKRVSQSRFFEDNPDFSAERQFAKAVLEVRNVMGKIKNKGYEVGFLIKTLYSCLVDADRYDSYLFECDGQAELDITSTEVWQAYLGKLCGKLRSFEKVKYGSELEKKVAEARKSISDNCLESGELPCGIYTLTVPTGGGKTLASLGFALKHAARHAKSRIIYVIPYTTIIEQNAKAVLEVLGCKDELLEYHSNVFDQDKGEKYELLSERFTSPIIFTTMVQFLNCIFASGNQNIRRFHNLENSVIIFDEIQSLPIKCTNLFCTAISYLKNVCGTTSVLCTATQPDFSLVSQKCRFHIDAELMNNVEDIFSSLHRVDVVDMTKQSMTFEELSEFVGSLKAKSKSVLCVMNTVKSAEKLYSLLNTEKGRVFLLTTRLCAVNRKKVIKELKSALSGKEDVICISTQLIEAGVDISFDCGIRSLSGLDSIAQTSGRINRNGDAVCGFTYVVKLSEENISPLIEMKIGQSCTQNVLAEFSSNKDRLGGDLLSAQCIEKYYGEYFNKDFIGDEMFYKLKNAPKDDMCGLLSDDFMHRKSVKSYPLMFLYRFETAQHNFSVIDNMTKTVIVPYRESESDRTAEENIAALINEKRGLSERYAALKKLQQYTVNLFDNVFSELSAKGAFVPCSMEGVYILDRMYYDENKGVCTDRRASGMIL